MRTWTRVLAEDDYLTDPPGLLSRQKLQLGGLFDALEVRHRPRLQERLVGPLTSGPFPADGSRRPLDLTDPEEAQMREARCKEFVRFYTVRAGGSYSLGCHDEWNIFVRLNKARAEHPAYGFGELIAAYYGGRARSMAESEMGTSPGYEVTETGTT